MFVFVFVFVFGGHPYPGPHLVQDCGANRGVQGCNVLEEQLIGVSWGRNGLASRSIPPPWRSRTGTQPDQMRVEGNTFYKVENHHHSLSRTMLWFFNFHPERWCLWICGLKFARSDILLLAVEQAAYF